MDIENISLGYMQIYLSLYYLYKNKLKKVIGIPEILQEIGPLFQNIYK